MSDRPPISAAAGRFAAASDAPGDRTPDRTFLDIFQAALADGSFRRLVLSRPRAAAAAGVPAPVKVSARLLELKGRVVVSLVETQPTRDLTRNLPFDEAVVAVGDWIATRFNQAHLFVGGEEIQLLVARKGRQTLLRKRVGGGAGKLDPSAAPVADDSPAPMPALAAHDRVKHRPIALDRPYLQGLGITDAESRLVPSMARKWKQINKFVEVLDHALAQSGLAGTGGGAGGSAVGTPPLEVLDFGSGKGYLTFAIHDHLRHNLGLPAQVTGIDLKADMIELCNRVAADAGAAGLRFELGDVASHAPRRADVMIALHACDTATDHAMAAGVAAGAAIIVCAPCCHKELRPQLLSPHPLRPILKHGVHLGQQAEMLTDGLRAMLLEACGYDTQVFEFVSLEHTGKNKMILASRRRRRRGLGAGEGADRLAESRRQVDEIKRFYGIRELCLERLLKDRLALPTVP